MHVGEGQSENRLSLFCFSALIAVAVNSEIQRHAIVTSAADQLPGSAKTSFNSGNLTVGWSGAVPDFGLLARAIDIHPYEFLTLRFLCSPNRV